MFIIGPRDTQEEINNQPATVGMAFVQIGQVVEAGPGQRWKTLVSKYLKTSSSFKSCPAPGPAQDQFPSIC